MINSNNLEKIKYFLQDSKDSFINGHSYDTFRYDLDIKNEGLLLDAMARPGLKY